MKNTEAIELVVYRLRESPTANKPIILNQTDDGLAKLGGYLSRQVFQSTDDEKVLLDYVRWKSLSEAEEAAKNMMQVPQLEAFVKLIEKTEIFEHFLPVNHHVIEDKTSDVVEVVVYERKEAHAASIAEFFNTYSNEIKQMPGYYQRVLLQSVKNNRMYAERVYWRSAQDVVAATAAMEKNPVLGAAFANVEKVLLMKHFVKL